MILPLALSTISLAGCVVGGLSLWFTLVWWTGVSDCSVQLVRAQRFSDASPFSAVSLAIPVLIAAVGTCAAWQRAPVVMGMSALLLAAFSFIGGFSIGGAYQWPAGLLLLAAGLSAIVERGRTRSFGA